MTSDLSVQFTQYLRPFGHRKIISTVVEEDVYKKAQEILAAGLEFEIEVLHDNITVSMTITGPDIEGEERDLDIRLCRNGPEVPGTVRALIMEFDIEQRQRGVPCPNA